MKTSFSLLATAAFATLTGFAPPLIDERVTITIHCGSQGIVDAPYRVSLTVVKWTGKEYVATTGVPKYAGSKSIATDLAQNLNDLGVDATTAETTAPNEDANQAEDIVLPDGFELGSVKVEKLDKHGEELDDGHLKAMQGMEKVSNPDSGSTGFSSMHLTLQSFTGEPLGMRLSMLGYNGIREAEWHKSVVFPDTPYQPILKFFYLGNYLDSLGFTVSYPSASEMVAVPPSDITLLRVYYTAYEETNDESPDTHDVSFVMEVE